MKPLPCSTTNWSYSRRAIMQAMLLGTAAPWVADSSAFASSCGDKIVRIGAVRAPTTMNPFATWSSFKPATYTYDFLVGVDAQRFGDRKGFAKEWSVADDKLTWTFKIWPGMKWSDGQPATARDAAFTYNYLLGSMGKPDELKIGQNSTNGLEIVESITAVDDETLRIVTKAPSRWPIDNYVLIVPEHIWKDISYADARSTFRNNPPLVGTGPMIVAEFQQSQFTRLLPNEYFRAGRPAMAGLIENYFSTNDAVAQGLKSGSLDFGTGITAAQYQVLAKNPDIEVGQVSSEQVNYLAFNTASGEGAGSTRALQDPGFRDAIGYAIDQKVIVDRAFRGHADPGVGLVMPAAAAYYSDLSDVKRSFDLKEAARRLDAAGYHMDGDGVRKDREGKRFQLELITGTRSGTLEIPVAVVQLIAGWLGKLGIPVSVTQLESGALEARKAPLARGGGKWDLLVAASWLSSSPHDLLVLGRSDAVLNNSSYWKNEEFNRLASQVDVTVDSKLSKELVDQAVRLIYNEAPYIVLCYPVSLYAHRKDCFKGWGPAKEFSLWSYFPFDRLKPV